MAKFLAWCSSHMGKIAVKRGVLTLVCSRTGGRISSGAVYTSADLKRANKAKLLVDCPHCGKAHVFKFADARLQPIQGAAASSLR